MKHVLLIVAVTVTAVVWLSCDSDSPTSTAPPNQIPDLSQTPRENREAEMAAAVLSGEVMAPQYLYERVLCDLQKIREEFGDSLPVRNIGFWPHWIASAISARIDSVTLADSTTGAQLILDSLNSVYRCISMVKYYSWWELKFQGVLNPFALTEIYSGVPGMEEICPAINGLGDWSFFSLSFSSRDQIRYFFRYGFGDCPSGCINSIVFYFSTTNRTITYHGYYPHDLHNPEARPDWYDAAFEAFKTVMYPDCWSADST